MMRFAPIPKPPTFAERVEKPGEAWLREHPEAHRPRDYWSPFKAILAEGFRDLCAYSCLYEPVGSVDHFVSFNEDPSRAYDWFNYRYAASWINASKQNCPVNQLLDPFEIGDSWFEILLPSLQLVVSDQVDPLFRDRAEFVLTRLHLRDDERVIRQRRSWYALYQEGKLTLDGLRERAPLIAAAVEKAMQRSFTNAPEAAEQ